MEDLKPCPFCTSGIPEVGYEGFCDPRYSVKCHCGATMHGSSEEDVVERWNRRQSASGEREALHGGAQALSQMAHDMERRKIDKTEGLRNYAATLRQMAARMK